ncbi:MAG: ROK family protein [Oscillospiraceae bacterium]
MKYYLGIDLGGTKIAAGVCDEQKNIVYKMSVPTNCPRDFKLITQDMLDLSKEVVKKVSLSMEQISWVGVGCPGSVNGDTGVIEYSNNLDFHNVNMLSIIKNALNKKVFIDNDANAAAFGEYVAGASINAKTFVMITLGTGVGGGIVINDSIYRGFNFAGAELGHMVIDMDGRQCTCTRKGCFEAYASATGLIMTTKEVMKKNTNSLMWKLCGGDINSVNGRTSFDAMKKGDLAAKEVVDIYIKHLATGLVNVVNIFQPEILCIGGGISKEGKYLLDPLQKYFDEEVYSRNSSRNTKVVTAKLGNDAGIIGAAMLGFSR